MKLIFKNKKFYIILLIVLVTLFSTSIYLYDKVSINSNFLKLEEKFLTNYSREKFIKKTLQSINICNKPRIEKYIINHYEYFLKKNSNLSDSIIDFTSIYDEANLTLVNLKKIKAITERDYIFMNNSFNKLDFQKISDKLLYLTLKNSSNDILAEKAYFEGLINELMFKNDFAEKSYVNAVELNAYNPKYYNALGNSYYNKYDFIKAVDVFERGLNIPNFNNKKYKDFKFVLLTNLAKTYLIINDFNNARNIYTYISINAKDRNNINYEYLAVYNLANIEVNAGNYKTALDYLKYSLKLANKLNNKKYIADNLNSLSSANYKYGNYSDGKRNGLKAIKIAKRISDLSLISDASLNVCLNYEYLHKMDLAKVYCKKSIRINNILSNNLMRPEYSIKNGFIYSFVASVRNYDDALFSYEKAYEISKKFGLKLLEIKSLHGLSECNNVFGNKPKSLKYLDNAVNSEMTLNINEQACNSCNYGFIYWGLKDYKKAIKYYEKGLIKSFILNNKITLAGVTSHLASVHFELKQYKEALKYSTLSLNTDKEIYRYDHHYIQYQENWQDKIIQAINSEGEDNVIRENKKTK